MHPFDEDDLRDILQLVIEENIGERIPEYYIVNEPTQDFLKGEDHG